MEFFFFKIGFGNCGKIKVENTVRINMYFPDTGCLIADFLQIGWQYLDSFVHTILMGSPADLAVLMWIQYGKNTTSGRATHRISGECVGKSDTGPGQFIEVWGIDDVVTVTSQILTVIFGYD